MRGAVLLACIARRPGPQPGSLVCGPRTFGKLACPCVRAHRCPRQLVEALCPVRTAASTSSRCASSRDWRSASHALRSWRMVSASETARAASSLAARSSPDMFTSRASRRNNDSVHQNMSYMSLLVRVGCVAIVGAGKAFVMANMPFIHVWRLPSARS